MLQNLNILDLIIILGAVNGIIFSVYLWFSPLKNKKASFFLSVFILAFAANSLYYSIETLGLRGFLNAWDFAPIYCSLLIIIAFYFFIHFLINPQAKLRTWEKLLFIPYLLQLGIQLWGLFWVFYDRDYLIENQVVIFRIYNAFDILTVLMGIILLISCIVKLKRYDRNLQNNYAEILDYSLQWLYRLILILLAIWLLFAIPSIYEIVSGNTAVSMYYPLWIFSSLLIYWIGYSTYFRRREVVPEIFVTPASDVALKLSSNTKTYHEQLLNLMLADQPFLDHDLNLKSLADQLDLSSGYLSQIINEYEGKNFFEFVNSYRIQTVKEKISNPEFKHLNLLGIAYESGFKSKSTFNLSFKKQTGLTPTAYKKSLPAV